MKQKSKLIEYLNGVLYGEGVVDSLKLKLGKKCLISWKDIGLIFLFAALIFSLTLNDDKNNGSVGHEGFISGLEAGERTVDMVNKRILQPSPNNVTAEYISFRSADHTGLPNFYEIKVNVSNPSGEQTTKVYTRKDGEVVFLQMPRHFDQKKYQPDKYH